jgi:class 3 adenylate cyclase/tetratricopeptide (TPR) repeat protein
MTTGPRLVEERKVVSILFVDLVDFTARSDQADPEDVKALLRPYHARLRDEIERLGGTVEKFIGDAVMAVFGAPVAHEDDAERAVRGALGVIAAVAELNEGEQDLQLSVRAAVNTGEAVVDLAARPEHGEGIVAGDVVNTAARLQQAAPPGGVVVGETTYQATREAFDYEPLDAVEVKGKAQPLSIWRATLARDRPAEARQMTPFIGRDADIALLEQTYARTVRERSIQLVTITGEPGVGKTRLVGEFAKRVSAQLEPATWRRGRCLSYGEGITFWALGEIVKSHVGILESDGPAEAERKLVAAIEGTIEDASEREWFAARLGALVGTSVADSAAVERGESFTAWRRFLEAVAHRTPLVLVVEDIHWADGALLDFLEHLADWCTEVPMFVVCTARPELFGRRATWGGGKRNASTISLSPLTAQETAKLVAALLSQAVLPAETQAVLLERAGGNPLYAEEFARMLLDRGILQRRGRTFEVAADREIPVPETVHALIAARLDTLTPEHKSLIQDAAVLGKTFWAGAVASMTGIDVPAVRESFHELARKEFVRPARTSSVEHEEEYSFWHVLVRDVAYGQIPRAARSRKHRAAAAWIEQLAGERVTDHAEFLAHHYRQALELARRAGADNEVRQLEEPTARFLVMAGDRAFPLDVGAAEDYYRQALEHLAIGHGERARVAGKAADAAWLGGRLPEAEQFCELALAEFRGHGNPLGEGEALVRVASVLKFRGDTARAWELLERAAEILEREPSGPELVRAYAQLARDHMLASNNEPCLEYSNKTIELAQALGMEEQVVFALQTRGSARSDLGDIRGLDDLREARRRALDLGIGHEIVRSHNNLGSWVLYYENPAAAHELFDAGIELGQRRGQISWVMWGKAHTLWTLFELGRWDELLAIGDELVTWEREYGRSYVGAMALAYQAYVLVRRGDVDGAVALKEEFVSRSQEIADPQVLHPATVIAAAAENARGDNRAALAFLEEFEGISNPQSPLHSQHLADAVRIAVASGSEDLARRLLVDAETITARGHSAVLTGNAVLAEARRDIEGAGRQYLDAAERWAEHGVVLEHAEALLGVSRCLVAAGRSTEAAQPLGEAQSTFMSLGTAPLVAEAEGLFAAIA